MTTKLVFESNLAHQVLRQEGTAEVDPFISLQLEFTDGPQIYTADSSAVNEMAWSLKIQRHGQTGLHVPLPPSTMNYVAEEGKSRCILEVHQSPERYADMLAMFRGGYLSEITVIVEGFVDNADYSKLWDTDARESIAIKSICFEFPLPQNES